MPHSAEKSKVMKSKIYNIYTIFHFNIWITHREYFIFSQVLDERVYHIEYAPEQPEPYYKATGKELQPRPVGEEHGIIVYNYMPISAVHYVSF